MKTKSFEEFTKDDRVDDVFLDIEKISLDHERVISTPIRDHDRNNSWSDTNSSLFMLPSIMSF